MSGESFGPMVAETDVASASKMPPCQERSDQTIQRLGVESLLLEGQAFDAVAEAQLDDVPKVLRGRLPLPPKGRGGEACLQHRDLGPMAVHFCLLGDFGRKAHQIFRGAQSGEKLPSPRDLSLEQLLGSLPLQSEPFRVCLESQGPTGNLLSVLLGPLGLDLHAEAEPVQELGSQLSLLGIHGSGQNEPAG